MPLNSTQTAKLLTIKQIKQKLEDRYNEIIMKDKHGKRIAKCVDRKHEAANAKGGGLGILTGLVTKFKKAHKPKNDATMEAADSYQDAVKGLKSTINSTNEQIEIIEQLAEKFPTFESTTKTLVGNLVAADNSLKDADSAYQKAKKAELAIYDEFMKYLKEKDAMKEGDSKEYKLWKKQIEENIKELAKD